MLVGPRKAADLPCDDKSGRCIDVELCEGDRAMTELDDGIMRSFGGTSRDGSACRDLMVWLSQFTSSWRRLSCVVTCLNSSESLKLFEQQFGAYRQARLRFPHRWHGVSPLHLIFRRLHSLLRQGLVRNRGRRKTQSRIQRRMLTVTHHAIEMY